MSKKKIIFNVIFFLVVTGLTIFYLISSNVLSSVKEIGRVKWWGFLTIVLVLFSYVSMDCFIIYRNMKLIKPDSKYGQAYGLYFMGNLGSNVTPWKSAHFPMIGYYLKKKGFNTEENISVMATNQIIYSTTLPVLYTIFFIYSLVTNSTLKIGDYNVPLFIFCLIGIGTNVGYFTALMLMMYNLRFQAFILKIEVKILKKFKKEFDSEEFVLEKQKKMEIYKISANRMWANIKYNIPSYLAYVCFMLLSFGLPYIIYLLITQNGFKIEEYMYSFLLCQASSYVTNIIPSPGGIGTAEFSFITVYSTFMGDAVNLAVILFRCVTFLLLVIIDFIFFTIFLIRGMLERKKQKMKENSNNCFENEWFYDIK
ncbi:uncharacterized membrane protein YbhN (UPF0104 family) [Anaeroplasma bactoclasticum]|uniref:Uncharacterized membrane protein YbhN (UPF0104 family) n=2 Tax=Anaeroplasma bactoclasticum TaxID=2088 RepID=A0A397RTA1_9MOLU|nr:uncharacterized membrane protein YbhN (UPF0104 family) [Anaeroplasma bactoclasticum]